LLDLYGIPNCDTVRKARKWLLAHDISYRFHDYKKEGVDAGQAAVVVCHPHPQHGGTMHNKVIYRMGRAFEDSGFSVLRFNFRSVELSDGSWDEGRGEADDAQSVAYDY
jgi:alpha/beta superfamily hydrolase